MKYIKWFALVLVLLPVSAFAFYKQTVHALLMCKALVSDKRYMTLKLIPFIVMTLAAPILSSADEASKRLIVHEWGTFTALQNEAGETLAGINIDDEPVPQFVHRLDNRWFIERLEKGALIYFSQGAPHFHQDVIMRLETPVIYFYPVNGFKSPFDVSVRFRGGWLTEFYPFADANAPGFPQTLASDKEGSILWKGLTLSTALPSPETREHVWLAPRRVKAASVSASSRETEKYLFYRGVANLSAPLRVRRNHDTLSVYAQARQTASPHGEMSIAALWLVSIDDKLRVAYRRIDPIRLGVNPEMEQVRVPADFAESAHRVRNLGSLRAEMKTTLVREGLYDDEAEAMLLTWELSYFKSPGLRLFFTVPRAWTDHILPLSISVPSEITRVMIGRIELVTPTQRRLVREFLKEPEPNIDALGRAIYGEYQRLESAGKREEANQVFRMPLPDIARRLNVELSPTTLKYLKLGRFRDALIKDEMQQRSTGQQ